MTKRPQKIPGSLRGTRMLTRLRATKAETEKLIRARPPTRSIPKYTYSSLSDPSTDIRLLKLLPGTNQDPILVQIDHACLIDRESLTESPPSQRLLEEINNSLPPGWIAYETWSHRIIYTNLELDLSTWQHPSVRDFTNPQENALKPSTDGGTDTPHYEALSYTWGSPKSRKAIFVQDSQGELTKLLVTKNLSLALQHLRSTTAPRTLWIDAICINQEDIEERNTQVKRMTALYTLAHRVVVWLGPGSPSSSLAMSTLEYLGEQIEISRQGNAIHTPGAVERHWYKESADLPYDTRTWNAVLRLSERAYFTRVWIMQELHLSNHRTIIQCGSDSMSWMNLRKAFNCLSTKRNLPSPLFREQLAVVAGLANYDPREPYCELTDSIKDRNCSNDRDRVYGLLGLMPKGLQECIMPNYDLTVGEVYRQNAVAQIEFFQRLDVLGECGLLGGSGPGRAIDAPSWVPDLILPHLPSPWRHIASGISRCYVNFPTPDIAEVSGLQVGTVSFVQEREPWERGEGIENTKLWAYQDLDRDAYALTLCGMTVKERWQGSPGIVPSLQEWKTFYYEEFDRSEDSDDTSHVITPLFLDYVERCIWSRTLFTTADGQIGLGPEKMQTGEYPSHSRDAVCVFLGCDSPMIVRQKSDGTYQVIGEAFVYALRDANALLGPLPEPWSVQMSESDGLRHVFHFLNQKTGEVTDDDPRLDPMTGWERLAVERGAADPVTCQKYMNIETGLVVNYDPRLSLESLEARGLKFGAFALS